MIRWLRLTALGIFLGVTGCDSPSAPPEGDVEIRVENRSALPFERVDVGFPEGRVSYGALAANARSDYRVVSVAYRYAYIEVQVNGEARVIQPIDYVGEERLNGGRYTYVLNLTVEGYLTLEFRRD